MSNVSKLQRHLIVGSILALGLGAIADQATSNKFSRSATSAAGDFFNWVLRIGPTEDTSNADKASAKVITPGDAGTLASRDLPARTQSAPVTLGEAGESRVHPMPAVSGAAAVAADNAAEQDRRDTTGRSDSATGQTSSNGSNLSGPRLGLDAMFRAPGFGSFAAISDHARLSGIVFDRAHLPWSFEDATSFSVKSLAASPSPGEATSFPLPDIATIPEPPALQSAPPDPGFVAGPVATGAGASSSAAAVGALPAALPSGAPQPSSTTGPVPVTSPLFASVPLAESLSFVAINPNPAVPQLFTPSLPPISLPSTALGDDGITGPFIVNPEPATLILTTSGLIALLRLRRGRAIRAA